MVVMQQFAVSFYVSLKRRKINLRNVKIDHRLADTTDFRWAFLCEIYPGDEYFTENF